MTKPQDRAKKTPTSARETRSMGGSFQAMRDGLGCEEGRPVRAETILECPGRPKACCASGIELSAYAIPSTTYAIIARVMPPIAAPMPGRAAANFVVQAVRSMQHARTDRAGCMI